MMDDIKWFMQELLTDVRFFCTQVRDDYRAVKRMRRAERDYKRGV